MLTVHGVQEKQQTLTNWSEYRTAPLKVNSRTVQKHIMIG